MWFNLLVPQSLLRYSAYKFWQGKNLSKDNHIWIFSIKKLYNTHWNCGYVSLHVHDRGPFVEQITILFYLLYISFKVCTYLTRCPPLKKCQHAAFMSITTTYLTKYPTETDLVYSLNQTCHIIKMQDTLKVYSHLNLPGRILCECFVSAVNCG